MLTISLIIPVYNEERHIAECLEAISKQTVMPNEVLVIDNNCSDKTISIAKNYTFVKVIKEPQQGLTHARNTGYNAATSDILGRIDADSQIEADWCQKILKRFTDNSDIDGLAGSAKTPLLPYLARPVGTFHTQAYFYNVHAYFRTTIMWGGNMALRRDAWLAVANDVCLDDSMVHEDQDLTLCLNAKSKKIVKAYDICVLAPDQSSRYLPKLIHYIQKRKMTATIHRKKGNLPVTTRSLTTREVIGSNILALPALLYGIMIGVTTFPIDYIAIKICHKKNWFN